MKEHFGLQCRRYPGTIIAHNKRFSNLFIFVIMNCVITASGLPLGRSDSTISSLWRRFIVDDNNNNIRRHQQSVVALPHCSKAIVTASQSSRLTRRSTTPSSQQMSLNVGVAQTICFRLDDVAINNVEESWRVERGTNSEESKTVVALQRQLKTSQPLSNGENSVRRIVRPLRKNYAAESSRRHRNHTSTVPSSASKDYGSNNSDENRTTSHSQKTNDPAVRRTSYRRGNLLHTVTVVELEQYYAITERYKFAIPEVETNCICECNPMASTCQADEWQYGECAQMGGSTANIIVPSSTCHRTFFPNQPSGSCPTGGDMPASSLSSSRLCCQLRFRAHQNRVFTALRLEPTTSHAVLQYSVFEYQSNNNSEKTDGRQWVERDKRRISVQLDGMVHNSVLDANVGLKLSILGLGSNSAPVQLETGMYYVENLPNGEFGEIRSQPLNRITEHDFHKLGWLRVAESAGGWGAGATFVQSGDIFIDKIHHAKTNNCAEQRFRSVLDASYYLNRDEQMNNSTTAFRLSEPLNVAHSWIRSARVLKMSSLRQAIVHAGEGVNLDVTLTLSPPLSQADTDYEDAQSSSEVRQERYYRPAIAFVHNSSRIVDFTGVIFVDRFSNTFLNLSLVGARGVLNGYVHQMTDWDGENIDTFTFTVPQQSQAREDATTVIERIKPYPVNSIQVVCLRPDDADLAAELCRPVQSVEMELEVNTMRNEWSYRIGSCAECNKISVEGFMKYLNPLNWTKGITSVGDALMLVSDVIVYLLAFLALYFIVSKIIIPLAYCCICPMHAFYAKSKSLAAYALAIGGTSPKKKTGSNRSHAKLTTTLAATTYNAKIPTASRLTPKVRAQRLKR